MKKLVFIKYFIISCCVVLILNYNNQLNASVNGEINFNTSYRNDNLKWNIPGNILGNNVNILSELTWSNLQILQFTLGGKLILSDTFYIRGSVGYGFIRSGSNQDSDYYGDNRTLEFSRSNNKANRGDVWDFNIGLGYQLTLIPKSLFICPIGGFAHYGQNLKMTDGFQTLDPYGVIGGTGPFNGLNSSYNAKWYGLWGGIDLNWKIFKNLYFGLGFEFHLTFFKAEADWNLRPDFAHPKSFEQNAYGIGINLSASFSYNIIGNWLINTQFIYRNWSAENGTDTTFLSDGTAVSGSLNEVLWKSYSFSIGVIYKY